MSEQGLTTITKAEMTERINGARWMHQLNKEQIATLAEVAVRYGYDPLMGEVTVYEGKIYVTLDGALRDAKRVPHFQGIQTTPLTQQEREARGIKQPIAYKAELYRADWRVPAVGIGVADPQQPFRNNPVERQQPHALAEARAIRRAVRLAREAPSGIIRHEGRDIDPDTGEIIDTTATVVEEPAPNGSAPQTPATEPATQAEQGNDSSDRGEYVCADCNGLILMRTDSQGREWSAEEIKANSLTHYKRQLCWKCSAEAKKALTASQG